MFETEFAKLPHSTLYRMRGALPSNDPQQRSIAPFEHRAFAREYVQENPVTGALGLSLAIPGYAAAKALGLTKSRTPFSFDQISQGYTGIAEGLRNFISPD